MSSLLKLAFIIFAVFLFQESSAQSKVIYVSAGAVDIINANGSISLPYPKIQLAIDNSNNGDTVLVERGVYTENVTLNKPIFLFSRYISSGDSLDILNTKINGNLNGSYGLILTNSATLNGFTIFNSYPGGLLVSGEGKVFNIITENNQGTGISVFPPQGSKSEFYNIITRNNIGHGFHEHLARVLISQIKSYGNSSYGLTLQSGFDTLMNAVIYNNASGGIWCWNSNSIISNSTIFQNFGDVFWAHAGALLTFRNSILWSNVQATSRISDARGIVINCIVAGGSNSISRNIETFLTYDSTNTINNPYFVDEGNYNFKLKNSSPAIGRSIPENLTNIIDIDGALRPNPIGSLPDLGAYESPYKFPSAYLVNTESGNKRVTLSWTQTAASGLARFKIYRSTNPIADNAVGGIIVDTISAKSTSYLDSVSITNLTRYYYRMKTIDSSGVESGLSNEISAIANTPPLVPDSFKVESGPRSGYISWRGVNGPGIKYQVFRSTSGGAIQKIADSLTTTFLVDSNLVAGTQYGYSVRAFDQYGVKSDTSVSLKVIPNRIFYISPVGSNNNIGSINFPKLNINSASALAAAGDTIILKRGVYKEAINLRGNISFLSSMYFFTKDTSDISATILSGENNGNSTLIVSVETGYYNTSHHIYGVTIENVRILAIDLNSATHTFKLSRSIIRNSGSYGQWGVIAVGGFGILDSCTMYNLKGTFIISAGSNNSPSSLISNNTIFGCSTPSPLNEEHAVIHVEGTSKARVINNLIYKNNATGINFGGNGKDSMIFINNTIALNDGYGIKFQTWGGVYTGVLINNISRFNKMSDVIANTVTNGPAVYIKNNFFGVNGYLSLTNLISLNNTLLDTTGNIGGDPFFEDTLNNNFRLKAYSNAIGSGFDTPYLLSKDIIGNTRPNPLRATPDIGAYESPYKFAAPYIYNTSVLGSQVRLDFKKNTSFGISKYYVYRSLDSISYSLYDSTNAIGSYVDDLGAMTNKYVYYKIKSIDLDKVLSEFSNHVSAIQYRSPELISPLNNAAKVDTAFIFKWSKVLNTTYLLQYSEDSTFVLAPIHEILRDTVLAISGLKLNTRYFWRVAAKDSLFTGVWSPKNVFETLVPPPKLDSIISDKTNLILHWSNVDTVKNRLIKIYRDEIGIDQNGLGSPSNLIGSVLNSANSYIDTSRLKFNTRYYYHITTVNKNNVESNYSNQVSGIKYSPPILISPINNLSKSDTVTTFKWTRINNATYTIQYSTDSTFQSALNQKISSDTTININGLNPNTIYYWRVAATDLFFSSNWSNKYKFETFVPAPKLDSIVSNKKKLVLFWSNVDVAKTSIIKIYRGEFNGGKDTLGQLSQLIDSVSATVNSYRDTFQLKVGARYYYRILAINKNNIESDYSNLLSQIPVNAKPIAASIVPKKFNNIGEFNYANVTINGDGSNDSDGKIVKYEWYVNDKLFIDTTSSFDFNYRLGTNVVKLIVTDDDGAKDSTLTTIDLVSAVNQFPGGILGGISALNSNIIYTADSSYDPILGSSIAILDRYTNKKDFLIVPQKIFTTPSIAPDTSVFITNGSSINVFDKQGVALWYKPLGGISYVTPTVDSSLNRIYLGVSNKNFLAYNAKTGQNEWSYKTDGPINTSAVISVDRKLIFTDEIGTLYGFDISTNMAPTAPKWRKSLGDIVLKSPALDASGHAFVGTKSGIFYKFDLQNDGSVTTLWQTQLGAAITSSPVIDADGYVYVGNERGDLQKLDPLTGQIVWVYNTGASIRSTPSISEYDVIYVANMKGIITAISTQKELMWKYQSDGAISANILYINHMLYFANENGAYVAIYDDPNSESVNMIPQNSSPTLNAQFELNKNNSFQSELLFNEIPKTKAQTVNSIVTERKPIWGTFQGDFRRTGNMSSGCPFSITIFKNTDGELVSSQSTSIQWYKNGQVIPVLDVATYKPTESGIYSVKSTSLTCPAIESNKFDFLYTAVTNLAAGETISLFPNPFASLVHLKFRLNGILTVDLRVIELSSGKMLRNYDDLKSGQILKLTDLPKGSYIFQIVGKDGRLFKSYKLMKLE